ncbi:aldehyde dehydrogenase family protein [Isoalcanivorax indicus]|uniref:aldehyde dehydrogenase family protein n=1 Tax=Isoalcanivorax indicus TaxID=2202653 RepID=UPI000DBAB1F6|nr:aldehyde dehydrogenase family protein [Isoalcanivorax indicus]
MSQFAVTNPATGEALYTVTAASAAQCQVIMASARAAAEALRDIPLSVRLQALDALLDYLRQHRERLLDQIVAESGRSRGDAMLSDLFQLTEDCLWLRHHAARLLADDTVPTPISLLGKRSRILYEPRGVVLVISPWNLPLAIGMTAAMFALVAGNAVVLKPSEHTPMREVLDEIRALHPLLSQALHVVHGDGRAGEALIEAGPDLIAFTGSLATGQRIMRRAADQVIPVLMELGARDPMLVFDDADLPRAVAAACWGNLHNSGQSCTAIEQLWVQDGVFDIVLEQLVAASAAVRLGTDANADLGVLTTDFQMRHVCALVDDALAQGATLHCGGRRSECGRYYLPTVLTGVTTAMRISHEEIFGPVLVMQPFTSEAEIIARHNACATGLSTSVWTADKQRAERLTRALATGCININNVMLTEGNAGLPFGGVRRSGFGRMKGAEGLRGMTRSKAVLTDPTRGKPEPNWYPYSAEKLALTGELLDLLGQRGPMRWLRLIRVALKIDRLTGRAR